MFVVRLIVNVSLSHETTQAELPLVIACKLRPSFEHMRFESHVQWSPNIRPSHHII